MLDNLGYRHTLKICNTYCFSTAKWLRERALELRYTHIAGIVESDYRLSHLSVWYTWRFKVICLPSTRILFHCTHNCFSFVSGEYILNKHWK